MEHGKIVEHWDVIEAIAYRDQWKNDNGKFLPDGGRGRLPAAAA